MTDEHVQLIVGLGNPGAKYERTRHNAGFWFVDELARAHGCTFQGEAKFFGEVARISIDGRDVRLLKPGTYMNESGRAVLALSRFFKVPAEQILVAYDEIDLPPGKVKLKKGGGHGGHNGVRDIISHLQPNFLRLRIGVGHPGNKSQVTNFVLGVPSRPEEEKIIETIDAAVAVIPALISAGLQQATHVLHSDRTPHTSQDAPVRKKKRIPADNTQESGAQKEQPAACKEKSKVHPKTRPVRKTRSENFLNEQSDQAVSGSLKDQLLSFFKKK